jgi:trans-2,3-dihydro-3-hydroxyanthranilate isomerase
LLHALSAKRFGVALAFDRSVCGKHVLAIEREFEMGRPSRMVLGFKVRDETLRFASIGGSAVIFSSGALTL